MFSHFSSWLGLEAEKVIVHGPAFNCSEALILQVKYYVLECSGINAFKSNVLRFLSIKVLKCSGINALKSNVFRFLSITRWIVGRVKFSWVHFS